MRYFVFLLTLCLVTNTVFASSYAQSDEFEFVNLNDSYLLGEEFSIVFQKITRQPCPSYDVVLIKEGAPESKITATAEPMCALSGLVEPYLFSATFEKLEFFDSIGTYSIKVMLDDKIIDTKIKIINSKYYSHISPPLKQLQSGIPINEIECKETLLLIKKHNGTPICVTPDTREKLIERGWSGTIHVAVNRQISTVYLDPPDISSANNQFAMAFYSNLTQNDSTSNVFFSPTSISTAFSMLYEGARQNTSQEIQQVFGFPKEDNLRHSGYLSLHQSINKKSNTDTEISIANALWLAENFEPLAEYIDTATTFYDSTVSTVDFVSDDGVEKINKWVDDKTQGKITDILKLGSTDSNTKMAITNAIYFKGLWEYPFDPEDTYESEFMIDKDNSVNVQMMTFPHKMQVNYTVTEKMEMIELPYRNGTVSLLIILPNEIGDLRAVEESITIDNLKTWQDFPTLNRGINIHIPKFTLETEYDLIQQLPDMGMPTVFNPVHADLSGITGYKSLYVSQAIHKAFVEVNEKGTEAAGATVIVTDESGGQPFRVDHPFVFIIQDNETDNILFMGRVVDPK